MKIRKAKKQDLKEVIRIFKKEYAKPPYNEKWENRLLSKKIRDYFKGSRIAVSIIENKVVGFIIFKKVLWTGGYSGFIEEVAVDSKHQRKGVGKALIKHAEDFFRKNKIKEVSLMSNAKSKAFKIYKRLKYKKEEFCLMTRKLK